MISFVIPYRKRPGMIDGYIANISRYYNKFEIILADQADDGPFLRGQLCNLGFLESQGDLIVFNDIDIRYFGKMEFSKMMRKAKHPFVPFHTTTEVKELKGGEFEKGKVRHRPSGWGACAVFTREQFQVSNGFSNLCIGWGAEDNIMHKRINYQRINGTIGHVSHKSAGKLWIPQHTRNYNLWRTEEKRDAKCDSYRETVYKKKDRRRYKGLQNVVIVSFYDIGVPENFKYKDLL